MSDDPKRGASTIHASKDHDGGGAGKWLLGGLAAVVLAGAGYFAWQTYGQNQNTAQTQTAYNDPYASEPVQSGAIEPSRSASSESAPSNSAASPASRSTRAAASRSTAAEVPEETIGITPVSASTNEAADQTEQSEEVIVTAPRRPVWASVPSAQRLASYYPEHAREVGREGEASLSCTVLNGGALNCAPVSEYPARAGFGAAALRVAHGFRHSSQTANGGDAVGSPVNLRVVFRMEDGPRRG